MPERPNGSFEAHGVRHDEDLPGDHTPERAGLTRRVLLVGAAAAAALPPLCAFAEPPAAIELANDDDPARKLRPQANDRLAYAQGPNTGKPLLAADVAVGDAPVRAWPVAPDTSLPRNGSRLNMVRVLKVPASELTEQSAAHAAIDGEFALLAFAATCSHAGCDIGGWNSVTLRLVCPCHGSEFDVHDGAAATKGPATKPLAMLPLRIESGALVAVRGFTRQVGFKPA